MTLLRTFSLFILVFVSPLLSLRGGPLDTWKARYSLPTPSNLKAIAFGNGKFVAVGDANTVETTLVSTNGFDWEVQQNDSTNDLNAVIFVNNQFVSVGSLGEVLTSVDAEHWDHHSSGTFSNLAGITFGNGTYVAAGAGVFINSTDAVHWTQITLTNGYNFNAITFGNGSFVAVGDQGMDAVSTNGSDWEYFNTGTSQALHGVAFGGSSFLAVGDSYVVTISHDGKVWSKRTENSKLSSITLRSVGFNGFSFSITGTAGIFASRTEGDVWALNSTWNPVHTGAGGGINSATLANGIWVIVGDTGTIAVQPGAFLSWSVLSYGTQFSIEDMVFDGTKFVAAAADYANNATTTVMYSADGSTWTNLDLTPWGYFPWSMAYGNSNYVMVCIDGSILASTNATNWSVADPVLTTRLSGVTYYGNSFYAAGYNGVILTSSNGFSWQLVPTGLTDSFYSVATDGQNLVAVGGEYYGPSMIASGTTNGGWTVHYFDTPIRMRSVTYGLGMFVAVGEDGEIFTSTNTIDWVLRSSGVTTPLYRIFWSHGMFVAVGYFATVTSYDGINWTVRRNGRDGWYTCGAFGKGTLVVAGQYRVVQSGDLRIPNIGGLRFNGTSLLADVEGEAGQYYDLEVSSNLHDWHVLSTFTNVQPVSPIPISPIPNGSQEFFRVRFSP
jgi:hypothetical protein